MVIKATISLHDAQGQKTRVTVHTLLTGQADTLGGTIAGASNCGRGDVNEITATPHNTPAATANYQNVEDKAQLTFIDTAGQPHNFDIPAPRAVMFLADQETVDPADPTGVIAQFHALAVSSGGLALTFVSGRRTRRLSKRG